VSSLSKDAMNTFSSALGTGILLLIIIAIVLGGMYKKIDVLIHLLMVPKRDFTQQLKLFLTW